MTDRPPYTIVIAPHRVRFVQWCRENNEDPRDRKFIVFSDPRHLDRGHGFNKQDGDRLIVIDRSHIMALWPTPSPKKWTDESGVQRIDYQPHPLRLLLDYILRPCGFVEYEDVH